MFSRRVAFILKFFDFCGFFTEYSYSPAYQLVIYIVFILHICFAIFFTLFIGYVLFSIKSLKLLDSINEFVQYQSSLHSYYILIIESYLHRKEQRCFWKIYKQINDKTNFECRSYSQKLIEFFVVGLVTQSITFYLTYVNISVWFAYAMLNIINHFRLFYYIFYLELISSELEFIETKIKKMVELSRFSFEYCQQRNSYFRGIRVRYAVISELIGHLNKIFSSSNFSTMMYQFYFLFTSLNYAYLHFNDYSLFYHAGKQLHINL